MKRFKINWINKKIKDKLDILPEYEKLDINGPLSALRYGKGSVLEELGTLYKLIGDHTQSKEYYLLASHTYYLYDESTPPEGWQYDNIEFFQRLDGGRIQYKAAICAILGKDEERAKTLFSFALKNLLFSEEELEDWRPNGENETPDYGRLILKQAYIYAKQGKYSLCLEKATEAQQVFQYFKNKSDYKVYKEDRYPARILIELAKYKLNPTEEQKNESQNGLKAYADACQQDIDGIMNFLYIYDFQEAYPDVFEPVLPN